MKVFFMKKYAVLFSLLFVYNVFGMDYAKSDYDEIYRDFAEKYAAKRAKDFYTKANLKLLVDVAKKKVSNLERRTEPKSFLGRMFGGGLSVGVATFIGIYPWTKSGIELFNKFVPFNIATDQGSMMRNFITGTSVVLTGIAGYYSVQGFYDWIYNGYNSDCLKQHKKVHRWLDPEEKEKEQEKD